MKNIYSLLILAAMILSCTQSPEQPDIILINGRIWTGQDESHFTEALAIDSNRILQTGTSREIEILAGKKTRVIDLKGKLVIPGFNDAHIHFLGGSMGLAEVDLTNVKSPDEMIRRVVDYINLNPGKKWITGRGWQYTIFPTGLPAASLFEGMPMDLPILLRAYDGHSAWANQRALELAGINGKEKFSGFGKVVVDGKGNPTGALLEEAYDFVARLIPEQTREEKLNALRHGLKLATSLGITSMQNASGSPEELSLYEELLESNELTVRYAGAFSADETTSIKQIDQYTSHRNRLEKHGPMLSANNIKFMLDGVIESHTAAMLTAYADVEDGAKGEFALPLEKYYSLVSTFDMLGFRIMTHAIGDSGVREALNAYERTAKENPSGQRRHRVEHIETISPVDIPRFAQLGVLASMEPIHADPGAMEVWAAAIGEKRLPNSFAWASLLDKRAYLVFSSDWPACIDLNPIRGIHVAVNRRTPEGFPKDGWVVNQKISIGQALLAYTRAGAYATFEEHVKGQLKAGQLADLVVLSDDLFTIDLMKIFETKVLMTFMDGKVTFQSDKFQDNYPR